jgi:glycerophosphoryl diester phosphodiesterase
MSFDPSQMAVFRHEAPAILRGLVAERCGRYSGTSSLAESKRALLYDARVLRMRPQFIAYAVKDLPTTVTSVARKLLHLPLLTWTVRTAMERQTAERYADQIIFEGFRP